MKKPAKLPKFFIPWPEQHNLMNDLMSVGLHRLWKRFAIETSGVRSGDKVLDIAGGTGDLSALFLQKVGKSGEVWLTDINNSMLSIGPGSPDR